MLRYPILLRTRRLGCAFDFKRKSDLGRISPASAAQRYPRDTLSKDWRRGLRRLGVPASLADDVSTHTVRRSASFRAADLALQEGASREGARKASHRLLGYRCPVPAYLHDHTATSSGVAPMVFVPSVTPSSLLTPWSVRCLHKAAGRT